MLVDDWLRKAATGDAPPIDSVLGEPDRAAYSRAPHHLVTGYLTDGQEVPWAPNRSRA